ncbi:MAG: hypothetical protein IKA82_01835 [Clostridia bacterium]|nr:hypothetical protein [Clostridia bacterium]
MAKQHLYAKVPAKLSLYKKELSYDTFAVSSGINELYIKENILKLCEYNKNYKYTDAEKQLILDDRMPPVYMSYFSKKTGELIQSCVSFLSEDFTGEAHGHFAHSLVLSEEETESLITSSDFSLFSPSNFACGFDDVTHISVNSDAPSVDYPQLNYIPESVGDVSTLTEEYDSRLLHGLIYALLVTTSGKGSKSIYIDIDASIESYSQKSIELLNKILSVFPHHIRRRVSIISFSASVRKSNMTFFNVKFVYGIDQQLPLINKSNAFIFNFKNNTVIGVKEEDSTYKKYKHDVEFLYSLLENAQKRTNFIEFACRMMPKTQDYKFENMSSIILLFNKITNAEDNDAGVLPNDDAIYNLLCAYERFKQYLATDERCCVLAALSRYSSEKRAIPPNVFGKLQKLYPSDTKECRAVMMEPVLTLIHTDIMREKLFQFIRKNYITETKEAKLVIMENLTRVFYGQFLQSQLLNFFDEDFENEDDDVKENIIKKLMASIRSEQIQDQIITFLNNHYAGLPAGLRSIVRGAMLEELPEADKLSQKIINFFEEHITDEEPKVQRSIVRSIFLRIEKTFASGDRKLIDLIFSDPYNLRPMSAQLLAVIIIDLKNVKVFEYFLGNMLLGKSLDGVVDSIAVLCGNYAEMPDEVISALENGLFKLVEANRKKRNLFDFIALDQEMRSALTQINSPLASKLYSELYQTAIKPIITSKLAETFKYQIREDCLPYVTEYITSNADYASAQEFPTIVMADNLYKQMRNHNVQGAVKQLISLAKSPCMTLDAAELLEYYFGKLYSEDAKFLKPITPEIALEYYTALAIPFILDSSNNQSFGEVYGKCMAKLRTLYVANKQAELRKKNKTVPANEIKVDNVMLAELTFKAAVDFCKMCKTLDVNASLVNLLYKSGESSLTLRFFESFVKENAPKSRKLVKKCAMQITEGFPQLYTLMEAVAPDILGKKRSIFSIFAKKTPQEPDSQKDVPKAEAPEVKPIDTPRNVAKSSEITESQEASTASEPIKNDAETSGDVPQNQVTSTTSTEPQKLNDEVPESPTSVRPERMTSTPTSAPSQESPKRAPFFKKTGKEKRERTTLPSARMEKLPRAPKNDTNKDT